MKRTSALLLALFLSSPTLVNAASLDAPAPAFELKDLSGKSIKLADYKNKIVFVNFWASWCPPCAIEFPKLNQLGVEFADKNVVIIAISLDSTEAHITNFLNRHKAAKSAQIVVHDQKHEVAEAYGIDAMPTTYVVDQKGVIRYAHRGFGPEDEAGWRKEITMLLLQKKK